MADTKITGLTALTGANVTASTDVMAIVDLDVTTTKKITVDQALIAMLASTGVTRYYVGSFTRDMTAASGSVGYTGVGFKPKAIIFLSGAAGGSTWGSVGFTDGTTDAVWYNNHASSADSWVINATNNINATTATGASQVTAISSLDSDGFTLSWTKTGSPTGTATVVYIAIR